MIGVSGNSLIRIIMNPNLNKALAELSAAGAQGLPNKSTVETAKDGSSWTGKKSNGDMWELAKNSTNSYNCMC